MGMERQTKKEEAVEQVRRKSANSHHTFPAPETRLHARRKRPWKEK